MGGEIVVQAFLVDPAVDLAAEVGPGDLSPVNVPAAWVGAAGGEPQSRRDAREPGADDNRPTGVGVNTRHRGDRAAVLACFERWSRARQWICLGWRCTHRPPAFTGGHGQVLI